MCRMLPTLLDVLDRTIDRIFPQLLEELAFADSWAQDIRDGSKVFSGACDFDAPWEWSLVVEGSRECLLELASGFHSLPDVHMDDLFAEEFLLEVCARLGQRLATAVPGAPYPGAAYPRKFAMEAPEWERVFAVNESTGWIRIGIVPVL